MIRVGSCFNHEPHATEPLPFVYAVGDPSSPVETWAEGLSMFHNPRAVVPVPRELFPGIAHHWLDEQNRMRSVVPAFHPYGSFTQILNGVPDPTTVPQLSPAFSQLMKGQPPTGGIESGGTGAMPGGVRRISRAEYRSHNLARGPVLAPAMEKAWFADDKGRIGTVFLDVSDKDWNFAVLAQDADGEYRWVAGNGGLDTQESAEQDLMAEMLRILNICSGICCFPEERR
jgi:hypothetical protein